MGARAAIALLGFVTLAALPIAAQSRWERQVQDQLRIVATDLAPTGWRYVGSPFLGQLHQGDRETLRIALREGSTYAFVALCDEDCRNIDVAVLGERDTVLARSEDWSDTPLLEVTPTTSGKYRVVVTMSHCGTGPCAYGVGVFQK